MSISEEAIELHEKLKGKLEIKSRINIKSKKDLSLAYTPGVAEPCRKIAENPDLVYTYTNKWNTVAVISDGSAVLGLGNIGGLAGYPVMEGKSILFKEFANVDSIPIILDTQDEDKIIETVKNIAPTFGGINLEDIAAPKCFKIEKALQDIGIPVFHDDQHGTEIVVVSALINACKVLEKDITNLNVVVSGAGAAGIAITKALLCIGTDAGICSPVNNIIICDSKGIIYEGREDLDESKEEISKITNKENRKGTLEDAMKDMDVFIGVSKGGIVTQKMVRSMNDNPIIFAMANPVPEIMPDDAFAAGASIVGTGRSDFPNQINNVLAFPAVFRGALDVRAKKITPTMRMAASKALAESITPTKDKILPEPFDKGYVEKIVEAVKNAYRD